MPREGLYGFGWICAFGWLYWLDGIGGYSTDVFGACVWWRVVC